MNEAVYVEACGNDGDDPLSPVVEREMGQRQGACTLSLGHEVSSLCQATLRETEKNQRVSVHSVNWEVTCSWKVACNQEQRVSAHSVDWEVACKRQAVPWGVG